MGTFWKLIGLALTGVLCLLVAVVASDSGPWYFAWLLGTMMIILISVAGGVLFETQLEKGGEGFAREEGGRK